HLAGRGTTPVHLKSTLFLVTSCFAAMRPLPEFTSTLTTTDGPSRPGFHMTCSPGNHFRATCISSATMAPTFPPGYFLEEGVHRSGNGLSPASRLIAIG